MRKLKITLQDFKKAIDNGMSILHLDIETSISQFYSFYCGKQYISHDQIVLGTETKVMSVQYKFEGDKDVKFLVWDFNKKTKQGDDSRLLKLLATQILPKADIVCGQNLDAFDYKVLNDRLMLQELPPLDFGLTIDILKLSRQSFRKISHKLDFRSRISNLGGKHRMERQDWIDIVDGKKSVLEKMIPYGCKDVDDAQRIMHKEFNYYKALPVKVQRCIKEYLSEESTGKVLGVKCLHCEALKERKFDVKVFTQSIRYGIVYECQRCKRTFS